MKIETLKIEELKPYDKNARKHPKKQLELLCENIEKFGFTTPVLIDKDNSVIAGHGRIEALKILGRKQVPCVRMENLNEQQVKALRLADNKLAELAEWDMSLVIDELKGLDMENFNLTGFDKDLLVDDDDREDETPEQPDEAQSQLGDVYILGTHRLVCGDSTKEEDVLKLMDGAMADMVFTDPPYNVDYSGDGKETSNKILNDKMDSNSFDLFLADVFKNYAKISKKGAGWYVFHSSSTQHQFQKAIEDAGWNVKNQIIWNKPAASMGWGDYRWKHEPMFYCGKENTQFYGDRTHSTVLDMPKDDEKALKWLKQQRKAEKKGYTTIWSLKKENVQGYVHPTQKPVQLVRYGIRNSSKADDIVVDLFGGSGATLIACERMDRHGYIMELDPKYVDVIVQRYVDYTGNVDIIKNGKPMVWPKSV